MKKRDSSEKKLKIIIISQSVIISRNTKPIMCVMFHINGQWSSAKLPIGSCIRLLIIAQLSTFTTVHLMMDFRIRCSSNQSWFHSRLSSFFFADVVCRLFGRSISIHLFQSICCQFLDTNNEQKADAHDRCHCHFVFDSSGRTIVEYPNTLDWIQFCISRRHSFVSVSVRAVHR